MNSFPGWLDYSVQPFVKICFFATLEKPRVYKTFSLSTIYTHNMDLKSLKFSTNVWIILGTIVFFALAYLFYFNYYVTGKENRIISIRFRVLDQIGDNNQEEKTEILHISLIGSVSMFSSHEVKEVKKDKLTV